MSDYFVIVSDDDGHWYIIPGEMKEEFSKWVEATNDEIETIFDFDDCRLPGAPSWVKILAWEMGD